jgi:hypothetical protein
MLYSFELSMPGKASWNGRWSGEGRPYIRVRDINKETAKVAGLQCAGSKSYYYRWSDGWCACVTVERVDSKTAARLRKKSIGFCGYDWMIDSIINLGRIEVENRYQKELI